MDNNELCVVRLSEKLNTELAGDRLISPTLNLHTKDGFVSFRLLNI